MIKSMLITSVALFTLSLGAAVQSIPQQIEKLAKDPATAERAAKADVYIVGKKVTEDSTRVTTPTSKAAISKKKRKSCNSK